MLLIIKPLLAHRYSLSQDFRDIQLSHGKAELRFLCLVHRMFGRYVTSPVPANFFRLGNFIT